VDYTQVILNGNDITIPNGYEIDFGAIAKGYTSDSLIENFKDNGVQSAIVNLGGNVQTLGTKPDGSLWNVAITNPFSPSEELGIVSIEGKAVITSGNYERYFTDDDGNVYWHILDTSTGYPADNGLVSVTIVGESGTMCDALSTALYVMGTDKAIQYWKNSPNFGMVLVTNDKSIYITEDLEDTFQNLTTFNLEVLNYE
jgi:thiamine biosynthesis lipoprotein